MTIPSDLSALAIKHNVLLERTESVSNTTVTIAGRNYKVLGTDDNISAFRFHINLSTTTSKFEASHRNIGNQDKIDSVLKKSILDSKPKRIIAAENFLKV